MLEVKHVEERDISILKLLKITEAQVRNKFFWLDSWFCGLFFSAVLQNENLKQNLQTSVSSSQDTRKRPKFCNLHDPEISEQILTSNKQPPNWNICWKVLSQKMHASVLGANLMILLYNSNSFHNINFLKSLARLLLSFFGKQHHRLICGTWLIEVTWLCSFCDNTCLHESQSSFLLLLTRAHNLYVPAQKKFWMRLQSLHA